MEGGVYGADCHLHRTAPAFLLLKLLPVPHPGDAAVVAMKTVREEHDAGNGVT